MTERKHGSPIFYDLLGEMANLHEAKSHDYAKNSDPSGNYHFAGYVASLFAHSPDDAGFAGRLAEKIFRLSVLEGGQLQPKNESVADTDLDIAVIAALWIADRRNRRQTSLLNQAMSEFDSNSQNAACEIIRLAEKLNDGDMRQMRDYLSAHLRDRTAAK